MRGSSRIRGAPSLVSLVVARSALSRSQSRDPRVEPVFGGEIPVESAALAGTPHVPCASAEHPRHRLGSPLRKFLVMPAVTGLVCVAGDGYHLVRSNA